MKDVEKRFCPRCGATDKDFYLGLCMDCYRDKHSLDVVSFPHKVTVDRCPLCGKYFHKHRWMPNTVNSLQKAVSDRVKADLYGLKIYVDVGHSTAVVEVRGFLDERQIIPYSAEREIPLKMQSRSCESCSKMQGDYFEAKLQARRSKGVPDEEYKQMLSRIRQITRKLRSEDERAEAVREREGRDGTDFYFVHKQTGEEIVKKLQKIYRVRAVHSTRLGRKARTKHTYLIRI